MLYLLMSHLARYHSNSFHGSIILIYINISHSFPYHFDTILFVLFTVFFLMYPFCTQRSLSIIFKMVTSFNSVVIEFYFTKTQLPPCHFLPSHYRFCYILLFIRNFPVSTEPTSNITYIIHFFYMSLNCLRAYT